MLGPSFDAGCSRGEHKLFLLSHLHFFCFPSPDVTTTKFLKRFYTKALIRYLKSVRSIYKFNVSINVTLADIIIIIYYFRMV